MSKAVITALLSILFYLTGLFGGGGGQPLSSPNPPAVQRSYSVLGRSALVLPEKITVRAAAQNKAEPLGTVSAGETVTILDQDPAWYKIRFGAGLEGWVPHYTVELVDAEARSPEKMVLAYYSGSDNCFESLLTHSPRLSGIAPLGWRLDSEGVLQSDFNPQEMGRALYFAGNQELKTYGNVSLSPEALRLWETAPWQQAADFKIAETVKEWGLKGVLISLEGALPLDQETLFRFVHRLAERLKAIEAETILALPWDDSLDYGAAGDVADFLLIQNSGGPEAGPAADLPAIKQMLKEIELQTKPEQLILGLSNLGRDWSPAQETTSLSHGEVLELAARQGANIKWDSFRQAPFFLYGEGHEVWFENRYSLKHKLELVEAHNLGGIALTELGAEDPEIWDLLASLL